MTIQAILHQIYPLPEHSKQLLSSEIIEISASKGHLLMKANRVEKSIYFIKKGVVRAFSPQENHEITFWFGEEGDAILSMRSYVENQKGYEYIELLEDCELYKLDIHDLHYLYNEDIHIANWGRKLAEKELLKLESRIVSSELLSAKERYDRLMTESPSLLRRVPLKYIASYLGMTQVSLSRIRKER